MHLKLDVSRCVCEVKSDKGTGSVSCIRDSLHLERLSAVIIDTAEPDKGDLITFAFNSLNDVFGT